METPGFQVIDIMASNPPEIPYGVDMIGAPLEWAETKGKGIKVAVIDTGAPRHPDVKIAGYHDFGGSGDFMDYQGHGSHVCGTIGANGKIKGVAPEVELYSLKVANSVGKLSVPGIAKAIHWAVDNGMDVINMSLGGPTSDSGIEAACKRAYEAGIILVVAAGNYGRDYGVMYPAKYKTTIATAAVDISKQHPGWSGIGQELDIAAAGVRVWSTWLNGGYALLDGTSMATPHIAGAVALIQAKAIKRVGRKFTPDEIKNLLRLESEDIGVLGHDELFGCGVFSFGRFNRIKMQVGERGYTVNGQAKMMDVAPFVQDGRVFTPARYVAESLGAKIEWNPNTKQIDIIG